MRIVYLSVVYLTAPAKVTVKLRIKMSDTKTSYVQPILLVKLNTKQADCAQ